MKGDYGFRNFSLTIVWLWLFLFALLPFCLVTVASFMGHSESHLIEFPLTLENYARLNNSIYIEIFEKSFFMAGISTLLCLVLGYPFAYIIARTTSRWKKCFTLTRDYSLMDEFANT